MWTQCCAPLPCLYLPTSKQFFTQTVIVFTIYLNVRFRMSVSGVPLVITTRPTRFMWTSFCRFAVWKDYLLLQYCLSSGDVLPQNISGPCTKYHSHVITLCVRGTVITACRAAQKYDVHVRSSGITFIWNFVKSVSWFWSRNHDTSVSMYRHI
jgi:hypothetical protein